MKYIILKNENDAEILARTMITTQKPQIIKEIESWKKNIDDLAIFEAIDLTIIETSSGTPIYQYGKGLTPFYDMDMLGSFLHALTSLFYEELKFKFDSFTIDSVQFPHGKVMYVHKYRNYILVFIWTENIGIELNISLDSVKKKVQKYIRLLPKIE